MIEVIDDLVAEGGELLLVYWCGHGMTDPRGDRRLLTAGASERNLANRLIADIRKRFASSAGAGFAHQVFIVDACANLLDHHEGEQRSLPDARMQALSTRKVRQDTFFATEVGAYALFDRAAGAAPFTAAALEHLTAAAADTFPPDFEAVFQRVAEDLTERDLPHTVSWFAEVDGSVREGQTSNRVFFGDRPRLASSFVFRKELARVREVLASGDGVANICALAGMKGVGKSQLASAYAQEQERAGWELVAWISATSRDETIRQLASLAVDCELATLDTPPDEAVRALLRHIDGTPADRLIVFDNVENYDDLTGLLPRSDHTRARVVITSTVAGRIGTPVRLGGYVREQSVAYLRDAAELDDPEGAEAVADALGDLPVALTQAATTIRLAGLDYAQYLNELRKRPLATTLRRETGDPYPVQVATALDTAITTVLGTMDSSQRDVAKRVLGAMALLAETGMPRSWAAALSNDRLAAGLSIGVLIDNHLLTSAAGPGAEVTLHRLLAAVIRDTASEADRDAAVTDAIQILRSAATAAESSTYLEQRATVAATAAQLRAIEAQHHSSLLCEHPDLLALANSTIYRANTLHDPYFAIGLAAYVARHEHVLGPHHSETLVSRNNLASAYKAAGNLGRAIALHKQNVIDSTRAFGPDHPYTLTSRNNLASAYESAGDLDRAIPLLEQNLIERERTLGHDHPDTLTSRNNLAGAYESAGDLARAIPLYRQNLTNSERILGGDHPHTLTSRNNLAYAYESAGDLSRAIALYRQNLLDRERILGADHPGTLTSRNNLAGAFESSGDLEQAIPLYRRNLADRERILGPDHPDTLTSGNNLAGAFASSGDLEQAIPLYRRNLADRERILGPDHPDTLTSRNNLAYAYQSSGDLQEAIPLYQRNLADSERILGPDHPHTLASRDNLASAYGSAGDLPRAISLHEQNLADSERVLGPEHPDTLSSRNNLAVTYGSAGNLTRAIPLYKQNLTDVERVFGPDHPRTITSRTNLAVALRAEEREATR
ncbi:tetratricopeptide repeat protein [Microbacterium enclense]|uniref:tetratricopeptide repeat protein n=1 Tax=Microbacterium enclense TaxID=993073 RepID=UPI00203F6851|nr:tetratricopeptide repeat protein [Microbacterium enclense]MCM3615523.1 tetratricopeptide repeat protein [Microbacterium enclense]